MKIILVFLLSFSTYAKDINVLIIDTGVSLSHDYIKSHAVPETDPKDYTPTHPHGTHISGIVLKDTCKEVKLHSCNYYYHTNTQTTSDLSTECFKRALNSKIDYINYSSGGKEFLKEEKELIQKLLKRGVKIVTAAGNYGENRPDYFPAKYELSGMVIVGNLKQNGSKAFTSNYGFKDMVWEIGVDVYSTLPDGKFGYMTGSSQSTAKFTNKLLKKECEKYETNLRN